MDDQRPLVLVVDDDAAVGEMLVARLGQLGFDGQHVLSGEAAVQYLASEYADAVLADVRMPGMDGLELLRRVQRDWAGTPVLMVTAHASIHLAVEAMQAGAADFVEKPPNMEELAASLRRAIRTALPEDVAPRALAADERARLEHQPTMEKALERIRRAAPGMTTVLLRGETGTGKNVAARLLHDLSPRCKSPFITVHCAGIPEQLLESELFGHEAHAFTDAGPKAKPGKVVWAKGGTLFLDEIGEVPLSIQSKLLGFLDRGREYSPIGASRPLTADVRVVAATNRDLEQMVREGKFREELLQRINVLQVRIPPLRERTAEIEPLARSFLERFATESGKPGLRFHTRALEKLREHAWKGNIRQLENVVERLVVLAREDEIGLDVLREALDDGMSDRSSGDDESGTYALEPQIRIAEKRAIERALVRANGNKMLAARLLEISRRSLYNKLKEHGLHRATLPSS
jgi:DNA-binding NtrC family response regulator